MADVPDPYGIDLALDQNGDVVVWANGAAGTIDGPGNCVQALVSRMLTLPGELTLHPDYGSTFPSLVGTKYALPVIQGAGALEVKNLIEQDDRFLAGRDVKAEAVDGRPTTARVSVGLVLSGGDHLAVTDLANPGIDEIVALEAAEVADLEAVDTFDDFEWIAQDEDEDADLRDADAVGDLLTPTTIGD